MGPLHECMFIEFTEFKMTGTEILQHSNVFNSCRPTNVQVKLQTFSLIILISPENDILNLQCIPHHHQLSDSTKVQF